MSVSSLKFLAAIVYNGKAQSPSPQRLGAIPSLEINFRIEAIPTHTTSAELSNAHKFRFPSTTKV